MRRAPKSPRPDLVRARAVLGAMRDPGGKQILTVAQAVVWIDENRPELTKAWLAWTTAKKGNAGEKKGDANDKKGNANEKQNPRPLVA